MSDYEFIIQSNLIEGINRDPTDREIEEFSFFMDLPCILLPNLLRFVAIYQPGAILRNKRGLNVIVGSHRPPDGGPLIETDLVNILERINHLSPDIKKKQAYVTHQQYEKLHPFTDGNGRSGRMLWRWMMGGELGLSFLHTWYYQSLQAWRS